MANLRWATRLAWWLFAAAAVVAFVVATREAIAPDFYRIDVDVYRQGAQTWLDGRQLYGDVIFKTKYPDLPLPFTYPPIAAVLLTPMTWASAPTVTAVLTVVSAVMLLVSTTIVLVGLDVWPSARRGFGPAWLRRGVLASATVAAMMWLALEPVANHFACGQINTILMALVLADLVPRSVPWPRGLLLGIAISIKLTPAVFLLYLLMRRDLRAVVTALVTFAASVVIAFALAPRDSWDYWTESLLHTDRIGDTARNVNQNLAGLLVRLGMTGTPQTLVWLAACCATLALTVWAVRRLLRGDGPTAGRDHQVLALMCVALFGLLVSPFSWSHHWVWCVPVVVVAAVVGWRTRNVLLLAAAVAGVAVTYWSPVRDLRVDTELSQQLIGSAYVWWALAVILIAGVSAARPRRSDPSDSSPSMLARHD